MGPVWKFLTRISLLSFSFVPAGDVLQLPVPLRGADLLPGEGSPPGGLLRRDSPHVHAQGEAAGECENHGGGAFSRHLKFSRCFVGIKKA